MNSKSATELYNKCKSDFLAVRVKQEVMVQQYFDSLYKIDKAVFDGKVEIPENASLKSLVPEYYVDNPKQEVLDQQIDTANQLFDKINGILADVCKEAVECYSQYQVLASSKA